MQAPGTHPGADTVASLPQAIAATPTSGAVTSGQGTDAPPGFQVPLAPPEASTPHPLSSTADGGLGVLEPAPHAEPDSSPGGIAHSLRSWALSLPEDLWIL